MRDFIIGFALGGGLCYFFHTQIAAEYARAKAALESKVAALEAKLEHKPVAAPAPAAPAAPAAAVQNPPAAS